MSITNSVPESKRTGEIETSPARQRPILASLGTVLVDSFEAPPRPRLDISNVPYPSKGGPASLVTSPISVFPMVPATSDSRPSSPSPLNPSASSAAPKLKLEHRSKTRPNTASSTSTSASASKPHLIERTRSDSGVSTPQRSFDSPCPSPTDDVWHVLGGGGMYALVGGRIWLDSRDLCCVVDRAPKEQGGDFPKKLGDQLNSFGEDIWHWNEGPETKTTKSRLKYEDGIRYFEYINPPPRRTIESIKETPVFGSRYLHVSPPSTPEDLIQILQDLQTVKNSKGELWSPKILFEPHPLSCKPENRAALERVASQIDVLSPNHEELLAFYDEPCPSLPDPGLPSLVEPLIQHLLHKVGVGKDGLGVVVIRCGRMGSCVGTRKGGIRWFPAFFEHEDQDRVVDVSGAGNAFIGGYAAGLHLTNGEPYAAALYGTVSASFMVEQICLPNYEPQRPGVWNDDDPHRRLEELQKRCSRTIET